MLVEEMSLAFRREAAMIPVPGGHIRFPTRDQLGIARPAWSDPDEHTLYLCPETRHRRLARQT